MRKHIVDTTHIWGAYKEILLGENVMSRVIRFGVNGMTSLHRHAVDEIVIVELGKVLCYSGNDSENLVTTEYGAGERIILPAMMWHSCGAIQGISKDMPFALGIEYIFGDIQDGKYVIERHPTTPSKPTPYKQWSDSLQTP